MIARLLEVRAALLTLCLLGAAIGVAQIADRLELALAPREPAVFTLSPNGEDVARLAPITVTFASPPAERAPEKLLQLEPAPRGTYAWLSPRTLLFQPDFPGLLRGSTYSVFVPARPEAGLPEAVTKKFTVTGQLVVQQIIPASGDTEVPLGAPIIVQFSRSVAPLTTLAAQPTDAVVTFDPPLAGKGEWLNTSIYRFIPTDLAPSTTYRVRIAKGLTSAADGVLKEDFVATFATIQPAIDTLVPDQNATNAGPWQQVDVTFNQPMDPSAADGLRIRRADGDVAVPGTVKWNDKRTVLSFNPTERLLPLTRYAITVAKGLRGARGGVTAAERTATFATIALPSVLQTGPGDGQNNAQRFGINIQFATPMDAASLDGKLSITGFTADELKGRINVSESFLSANVSLKPSTRYTVTLAPGATDRYGQAMGGHRFSFATGALPASVSLAVPGYSSTATYSSTAEQRVYFQATNLPSVGFTLYPLTPDEGRRLLHDPQGLYGPARFTPALPALRTWTEPVNGTRDETLLGSTSLSNGTPLREGYYYVHTNGDLRSQFVFAVVDTVIVTKLSFNELLAWAVDHDSGRPVSGVMVRVSGPGATPGEAITDQSGLASFRVPAQTLSSCCSDRSYIAWIDDGVRSAFSSTRWQNGIAPYQFGVPNEFYMREWVGHLYTDRPIYRPSERVEFKGIVRADDDARYSVPPSGAPFQIVISNPRGQQLLSEGVTLNEFGSFAGHFDVPGDAPLGDYSLNIMVKGSGNNAYSVGGNSFLLAEFRTPEFQVGVTTPRQGYVNGDSIDVTATATFFFGGGLEGAPLDWNVTADPSYAMRVKGFERYSFVDFDFARQAVTRDALRAKGATRTGPGGVATFTVPATLQASEGPQLLTLAASVSDESGQAAAGSTPVLVHPSSYYVGVRPTQYVAREGLNTTVDLVTVDTEGAIVGGRAVVVTVNDREWLTVKEEIPGGGRRYRSEPKDTPVAILRATTDATGKATVSFKPTKPGTLRIVAEVRDANGRAQRSSTYLWVSGPGFATWQVTNDDTMKLVADKEQYQVGDTAEILVPAPFAGGTALVTVERGKLMTREVRTFATNSERLSIPITDSAVPDIFVSVVLYRGPTDQDPSPRFKVGYVELPVSTATRALNVQIAPDKPSTRPGETVRYGIRVTDHAGNGVKAEVSVSVVDKAVLALQDERGPDGLKAFWFERGLGVNTASSMTVSVDRWNDAVIEAARAGKGGSGLAFDRARQEFRNTAYWSAQLTTRDDGTASVDVKMPDNLTTWRMQVRAMSGDSMVGEGTNELVSAQPLMLRPALPRFLRVGDNADLRVLVRNSTGTSTNVNVVLKADGVTVSGPLAKTATIAAGASATMSWPSKVDEEGAATLTFTANGTGGLSDTLIQQLPVYLDMTPETMSTGGVVTNEGASEAIYLPPFANTTHGSLNVRVRSALVGSMAEELVALAPRPSEGAERVASRLIASLGVRRAEKSAGAADVRGGAIASDLAAIAGRQRPDGGWAWCDRPECQTDPNVTGWALLALGEARRDGLSVDAGVVSRASSYVVGYVNRPSDIAHPADISQKAFLLAALSSAGGGSTALTPARALFEQQRASLTNWGRAYLLLALTDAGVKADDAQVGALFNDLAAATIASANGNHWEDAPVSGSFVTSTGTTGLGTLALARVRPDHLLLPQTVRWLVLARSADGWHTSIDRALGVLALTTYAVGTGELGGDYSYKVLLDDSEVLAGLMRRSATPTAAQKDLSLERFTPGTTSILAVTRDYAKAGRLYYTLDLRYVTPAKEIEALNRGFAISHEYTAIDDPTKRLAAVKLGDTVRVKVTIIAPADRNYVVIEDLLPAGLEAVDARLKNVDPALKVKLEAERTEALQKQFGGYMAPWFRWYYSPWQQVDVRDDRAVLQADRLPKGVYEYVYYARATTPGSFFVAPAHAEETYFPEVFGRSDSSRFIVAP
jgi:alpha-2-macroglobulin